MKELSIEDKKLILKDLSARLPYGVKVLTPNDQEAYTLLALHPNKNIAVIGFEMDGMYVTSKVKIDDCKPLLRPMSSMTNSEKEELLNLLFDEEAKYFYIDEEGVIDGKTSDLMKEGLNYPTFCPTNIELYTNWLNEHHFDYRGLIEKGLAKAVTKENNPYKAIEE